MALSWSGRRKALYLSVAGVVGFTLIVFVYQRFFNVPPLCTDGRQNGGEMGVDCGGPCSVLCETQVRAPVVLWARSFESAPQTYTAAAYIQNNNVGAGARRVGYSFQLFDADNKLVVARDGVVDLPPIPVIPIIESGIDVGYRSVARTLFSFSTQPVWVRAGALPALRLSRQQLSPDASRLEAVLANDSFTEARAVVTAVLFDVDGVARAASKSTVTIPARGSVPVVFTWLTPASDVVRGELTLLPL